MANNITNCNLSYLSLSNGSSPSSNRGALVTPWLDYATVAVPDNQEMVMWWAQYMWLTDGNYRTAMERIAAHFMTTIEFPDLEPDEESAWKDLFTQHLNYRKDLLSCAYDYLCYGNSFITLYIPFRRFLNCRKCKLQIPIDQLDYKVSFTGSAPYVVWNRVNACPVCNDTSTYDVQDRQDMNLDRIKINRYSPSEIEISQNRHSLRKEFYWKIPDDVRRDIQNKARIHIDDTPLEVLEAVARNGRLKFEDDIFLHSDEVTLAGIRAYGWGVPRSISNFRTAWLQQLTNKADQAVVIDYTLGMRWISPSPQQGAVDPMGLSSMDDFTSNVNTAINNHRNNPVGYYTSPYPLEYKFMGGEGATLIPAEKLKFRQQEFLNQLGVPLEYHQMNLSTQAAPMALRLFESYWQGVPSFYNNILNWIVKLLVRKYDLPSTTIEMQKSTIADDSEYRSTVLQLMSANQLSPQTALRPLNIDAHEEVKKVYKHQDYVSKVEQEYAEKEQQRQELGALKSMVSTPSASSMAQQAQAGQGGAPSAGGPMGGAPSAGGPMGGVPNGGQPGAGSTPQSLDQMKEQAQDIASQLLTMPEGARKQQIKALRDGNKDLHTLVMADLEQMRNQGASQGRQQAQQPPPAGGGNMNP